MTTDLNDLALEWQGGSEFAASRIFRDLNPKLVSFFQGRRTPRECSLQAEDLASTTWLRVAKALPRWDPARAQFNTWVYAIATNLGRTAARDAGRYRAHFQDLQEVTAESGWFPEPVDLEGEDRILHRIELGRVLELLDSIEAPARIREAFYLYIAKGLSFQEIGDRQGCGHETSRSRVKSMRDRIRRASP